MNVTQNHRTLSRARLAEAHALIGAGEHELARDRLLSAADHALRALAASGAARDEHAAIAVGGGGAAPPLAPDAPLDAIVPEDDLEAGFERVQELVDAVIAHPAAPARPALPMYGGAAGALNARGAEAAARVLTRLWAAVRR